MFSKLAQSSIKAMFNYRMFSHLNV
ncbi:hypothetical protein, partial [Escherichia coli]